MLHRLALLPVLSAIALGLLAPAAAAQEVARGVRRDPSRLPQPCAPIHAPLEEEFPELRDQSSWGIDAGDTVGALPIGNGSVFAVLGLGTQAANLDYVRGPRRATPEQLELIVEVDGRRVDLTRHALRRVRGAGLVVTEDRSAQLVVRTLAFADAAAARLWQLVDIEAVTDVPDVTVHWLRSGDRTQVSSSGGPIRPMAAGETERRTLHLDLAADQAPPPEIEAAVAAALVSWRERLAPMLEIESDFFRLPDLVRDSAVGLLTMRDADTGTVLPMLGSRQACVSNQTGPLLLFLRLHLWREARAILEYEFRDTLARGRLPTLAPRSPDREIDSWTALETPSARDAALCVLHHYWYWRATRDSELIDRHWPLLDAALKKGKLRDKAFGDFDGTDLGVDIPRSRGLTADDPTWLASVPSAGRSVPSLGASASFILAIQALGELFEARAELRVPDVVANRDPEHPLTERYTKLSFEILRRVEAAFWDEDAHRFAPSVSPIDGRRHPTPFARENLMPLWIGWTFPTGEKSRENLTNTLKGLWRATDGRIGSTPVSGLTTGDLHGMLLVALAERDGIARTRVLDTLLEQALPAASWAAYYDPDGKPFSERDLLDPDATGRNIDAVLFALTGIRYASIPNWNVDDIRLEFRLPAGGTFLTLHGVEKDDRTLDLHYREVFEPMSQQEIEDQEGTAAENRRDPSKLHQRLRFKIDLVRDQADREFYNVYANAMGTMFVRYLQRTNPIDEVVFADPDKTRFLPLPAGNGGPSPWQQSRLEPATRQTVTFCCHPATTRDLEDTFLVDTSIPTSRAALERTLLTAEGAPRYPQLLLGYRCFDTGLGSPTTAAIEGLLEQYRRAGGEVIPFGLLQQQGFAGSGPIDVTPSSEPRTILVDGRVLRRGPATIRVGSDMPCQIAWASENGRSEPIVEITSRRERAEPDQHVHLVQLPDTETITLAISLPPMPDKPGTLLIRITDPAGVPLVVPR